MVAIKGMELPKSCAECSFVVDDMFGDATCVLLCDEWKDNENHRAENCPLVEIITCKGCKYWNKDSSPRVPDNKEYHFCPMMDCITAEDFFCAKAKRRE